MSQLTPNFNLSEFITTSTGLDNKPPLSVLGRLRALAYKLQLLRDAVGKPLYINSAYRSDAVNRAVGGSRKSYHLIGAAADISIRNLSASDLLVFERAIISSRPAEFIKYETFYHVAYDFSRLGVTSHSPKTYEEEYPVEFPPIVSETFKDDF